MPLLSALKEKLKNDPKSIKLHDLICPMSFQPLRHAVITTSLNSQIEQVYELDYVIRKLETRNIKDPLTSRPIKSIRFDFELQKLLNDWFLNYAKTENETLRYDDYNYKDSYKRLIKLQKRNTLNLFLIAKHLILSFHSAATAFVFFALLQEQGYWLDVNIESVSGGVFVADFLRQSFFSSHLLKENRLAQIAQFNNNQLEVNVFEHQDDWLLQVNYGYSGHALRTSGLMMVFLTIVLFFFDEKKEQPRIGLLTALIGCISGRLDYLLRCQDGEGIFYHMHNGAKRVCQQARRQVNETIEYISPHLNRR